MAATPAPDAGQLFELNRRAEPGAAGATRAAPLLEEPVRPALSLPQGAVFRLKGFRITHAAAFPETTLLPLLKSFIDKDVSLADLQRAADIITRYYRDHGYFAARAYIPAQDVKEGIVEIWVLEGRIGAVKTEPAHAGVRLHGDVVEKTILAGIGGEHYIRMDGLERALLLLGDVPGVSAQVRLAPGEEIGASIATVRVSEGPVITGDINFDDYGNRYSGQYRAGLGFNLNDPSGHGDVLNLRMNGSAGSAGSAYGRMAYAAPVGYSGFKLGASLAQNSYTLCCDFAALEASGYAQVTALTAAYPLIRKQQTNLSVGASREHKQFVNDSVLGKLSDKTDDIWSASVNADWQDGWGSGGINAAQLITSFGNLNLDGLASDRALDDLTAATHGDWNKVAYSYSRLQHLKGAVSLFVSVSGQFASKNLDSAEKIFLGGPQSVRAYPQGEAPGDEGQVINLELRYDQNDALQFAAFLDYGRVRLHREEWANWQGTNPIAQNNYDLMGMGVGLNWSMPGQLQVKVALAKRIGNNPGRDPVTGNDSDGAQARTRGWIQAVRYF